MIDEAFEEQCRKFEVICEAWYREKIRNGSPHAIAFGGTTTTFREISCVEIGRTLFGLDAATARMIRKRVALRLDYKWRLPAESCRFKVVQAA